MSDYLRDLFQLGQSTHRPAFVRTDVLGWICGQGRLAIIRLSIDCCPHTDATLPTPSRRIETTADDLVHAYETLAALYEQDEQGGGDSWFEIHDAAGRVMVECAPTDGFALTDWQEIPF